jgi:hypothetical protein
VILKFIENNFGVGGHAPTSTRRSPAENSNGTKSFEVRPLCETRARPYSARFSGSDKFADARALSPSPGA